MLSWCKRRYLTKIRQELNLAPLDWKKELVKSSYKDFDKIIEHYVKTVSYMWFFKNVAFYDEKSKLTFYFPRIILTRKNLYFIKAKKIHEPLIATITDPIWQQKQEMITSPIMTQQFMINRMIKLLKQKQFLRTCTFNLILLDSKKTIEITGQTNQDMIKIINWRDYHWSDIIKYIEKNDDLTADIIADETILELHYLLSLHSHQNNYHLQNRSLFCLYHYI